MDLNLIKTLKKQNDKKIVLLVMDGLGGLPEKPGGKTELEAANTPNLDELAKNSICGLHTPVRTGITPGSGPAHLGLFGYDPINYNVGRGVLSALGVNFDLKSGDVAARGNFCTVDDDGKVTDRRAGRIPTEEGKEMLDLMRDKIKLKNVEYFIQPVKEYRFLLVLRGEGLSGEIEDTDPQVTGKEPLKAKALSDKAETTAKIVDDFLDQTGEALKDQHPANMVLLRGFSQKPDWPAFNDVFGLNAAAIAVYPMYRGVAKLVGMNVLETGSEFSDQIEVMKNNWNDYDFFFVHFKKTDSAGEDGDFDKKKSLIEKVDEEIPKINELNPDVFIVTGDHSTPSFIKYHGWHPVPVLLHSKYCRADNVIEFGERACMTGGLGANFPASDLLPLALANSDKLEKYGA